MAENRAFADLLNHYLRNDKRSARWLAQEIGVHPSTVSRWTNGETLPEDSETVRRMAAAFKLSKSAEIEALVTAAGYPLVVQETGVHPPDSDAPTGLLEVHDEHWQTAFNTTLLRLANAAPPFLAASLIELLHVYNLKVTLPARYLHASSAESRGIELGYRRLFVANAFGSYFAGLLERDNIYVDLAGQVDIPVIFRRPELSPLARMMLAMQHPDGPHIIVIAAEGGMGKSTLAARVVRTLFGEHSVDEILGDSAKMEWVNAVTGKITPLEPAFYDWRSCCAKLYVQLGLPVELEEISMHQAVQVLRNRLIERNAVIVIDNLESVAKRSQLLTFLRQLTSPTVRIIVTTRTVQDIPSFAHRTVVVNLRPLTTIEACRTFLRWHIEHFQQEYTELRQLEIESVSAERIEELIARTGGIPLLLQLIISTIARSSWAYLAELPKLFGQDLLNFLYAERWQELGQLGHSGLFAQELLAFVSRSQHAGKVVTFQMLARWAAEGQGRDSVQAALQLLYARFLMVNHNLDGGNFTVFPSLSVFLDSLGLHGDT